MAREIPLTQGKVAIVDDSDYEWLSQFKWCMHNNGSAMRRLYSPKGQPQSAILMHREIIQPPAGLTVDHIDGDRLNNQRGNLRVCTIAENVRNKGKQSPQLRPFTTPFKGVHFDPRTRRWRASVQRDGKVFRLGRYPTDAEAARAYDCAAIQIHGEFARTNASMGLL